MATKTSEIALGSSAKFGLADRLLMRVLRHRVVPDHCGRPYLVRYYLRGGADERPAIYLHHILRSDEDRDLHDHPWPFTSLVLLGGYWEEEPWIEGTTPETWRSFTARTWRGPLSVIRHQAKDYHRVILGDVDRPAWTLVFRGPRERRWGFRTKSGWVHWKDYEKAGGPCE